MRYYILCIAFTALTGSSLFLLKAQPTDGNSFFWNYDTLITYTSDGNPYERFVQTFNDKGKRLYYLKQNRRNGNWLNKEAVSNTYDDKGYKLTETTENWKANGLNYIYIQ